MPSPCLKDFIATVPTCLRKTALATVLNIFSQNRCASLVVVTEQQYPLGMLHLSSLLPYLMADLGQGTGDRGQALQSNISDPNSQQPLSALGLSIIAPLATLSADLTLQQFSPRFLERPDWAIVDRSGKFLGLLDTGRLLQFFLAHPQAELAREEPPRGGSAANVEENSLDAACTLNPLLKLLERLPIPVMLQTSGGMVLQQNLAWRGHFRALQDPDWLRREAATLLEVRPSQAAHLTAASSPKLSHLPSLQRRTNPRPVSIPKDTNAEVLRLATLTKDNPTPLSKKKGKSKGKDVKAQAPAAPKAQPHLDAGVSLWPTLPATEDANLSHLCQIGPDPDSCVCVCPMENGADRVWQFVKIPLGNILSQLEVKRVTDLPDPPLLDSASFRLANIQASAERASGRDLLLDVGEVLPGSDLWLVLAQDVTEQQQVAKELAAKNADLMQLNRLKDEFLACISHELKTPLTAVLGLSSLLKDRLLGELNDRQIRYARLIHQSGRHLMAVVNDILDLTRIETGQVDLMLTAVDIPTVCDRAYEQARQVYLMQNNPDSEESDKEAIEPRFTLEIEPGLNSLVADELRLRQMLVHLLSNALKFTDPTGEIGLRVSRWEGFFAFCVWDSGIGIPEEKQHLIFQKFQQLESPLTRQFQGTGLGLVLTQRLAHLHGGDVSFISSEGAGSQFTLLLPPCPPMEAGEQVTPGAGDSGRITAEGLMLDTRSRLVLIVEGTSRFIEDLTQKLTSLGYRVAIARSGTEALAKARALQPLAILLNPVLPLLSGWDLLTLLKSDPQTCHIPAIVTATMVEKKQAKSNRADDFLSLPVELDALRNCLEQLTTVPTAENQPQLPATKLTILYLTRSDGVKVGDTHLSQVLHRHHYRVLEADDLEQAELLARIWHPRVVLLEREIADPLNYLQQLSQHQALAILPLVTLDRAIALAANQVKGLSVFPCLEPPGSPSETSAVLQAIQLAAGMSWKPNILVVNISMLPDLNCSVAPAPSAPNNPGKKRIEWLHALIQYLQTAGFKGAIARSWDEVLRQIQHRSVDLLLIELEQSTQEPAAIKLFHALRQFDSKPPTLVLERGALDYTSQCSDCQQLKATQAQLEFLTPALVDLVQEVATQIIPGSVSMKELLEQIRQGLGTGD
ncbi:MAG TPA: hybrid sensor histidine kinase/response regulator [Cyanobacteria bacterium UBA11369]|nr:hybrid sensor histidine kinase/response regulator [Cyanobacteria bacterium UBA11371]HBE34959.1 hybrid sensor histidine kinase/response regulator [Cyanobacteria bacterium UBA11368]HBE48172.1 hybrid sensor histidine kinase/response regulator [Cyanobacteria bacterium UBA11369]